MTIRSRLEAGAVRVSRALIARACRPLPAAERDERYAEWTAELPAIPGCHRFWPAGLLAMLVFSADQFRTTRPARRLARVAAGQQARKARSTRHHVVSDGGVFGVVSVVFGSAVASGALSVVLGVVNDALGVSGVSGALGGVVSVVLGVVSVVLGVVSVVSGVLGVVDRRRERSRRHAASGTETGPGVSGRQR